MNPGSAVIRVARYQHTVALSMQREELHADPALGPEPSWQTRSNPRRMRNAARVCTTDQSPTFGYRQNKLKDFRQAATRAELMSLSENWLAAKDCTC